MAVFPSASKTNGAMDAEMDMDLDAVIARNRSSLRSSARGRRAAAPRPAAGARKRSLAQPQQQQQQSSQRSSSSSLRSRSSAGVGKRVKLGASSAASARSTRSSAKHANNGAARGGDSDIFGVTPHYANAPSVQAEIRVCNVSPTVTTADLSELFSRSGPVVAVKASSNNTFFVKFKDAPSAIRAVRAYNGVPLDNRPLFVNLTPDSISRLKNWSCQPSAPAQEQRRSTRPQSRRNIAKSGFAGPGDDSSSPEESDSDSDSDDDVEENGKRSSTSGKKRSSSKANGKKVSSSNNRLGSRPVGSSASTVRPRRGGLRGRARRFGGNRGSRHASVADLDKDLAAYMAIHKERNSNGGDASQTNN